MLLHMYPKNIATIYAMTEASFSFAEMIGPTFGALLYNLGGFILPFEVCGGLLGLNYYFFNVGPPKEDIFLTNFYDLYK